MQVKKRIMHLNDDVAHIRENISDLKEAWKQKEEKVVERNAQTESLLSEILSKLAKGKPEHNESTQTDKAECYENSTQSLTVETRSLKIQTGDPVKIWQEDPSCRKGLLHSKNNSTAKATNEMH